MRDRWTAPMWRGLVVALLLVIGGSVAVVPVRAAHAAANGSGDTLSLSLANGTTFTYGANPVPTFTVVLTLATRPTTNYYMSVGVLMDNGQGYSSVSSPLVSADQLTYTFTVKADTAPPVLPGSRTATATYMDPMTKSTITSDPVNPVRFSVAKATPSLDCSIQDFTRTYDPNQTIHISMNISPANPDTPVDWQKGTYTIKFVGPTTVTIPNLQPDSNDAVTVQVPSQIGLYSWVYCTFSGTSLFTPATGNTAGQTVLVSQKHQLGKVEFYSNPTTLTSYQPADVYIVFHPAAGLPAPTGQISMTFGRYFTPALTLGPNGAVYVHLEPLPYMGGISQIEVTYEGDGYYDVASVYFPLTNPPIPGGVVSAGTQGKATATVPATGTPGATATAGDGAVPTVTGPNAALASQPGNGGLLWLWAALGVLVLGGGGAAGAMYFVRRSRRAAYSDLGMGVLDGERPGAGVGGNLDGVNRFGSGGGWGDGQG